jgi:hypothetical protein
MPTDAADGPGSRRDTPPLVLDAPAAAAVLVDPAERRFLDPFLGEELSISAAARILGESVERTAYRVRSFAAKGLLSAVREEPRKGRPIVIYTAPPEIRAPLALLPAVDIQHLFDVLDEGGRSAFLSSLSRLATQTGMLEWTIRVYRAPDGSTRLDMVSPATEDAAALVSPNAPSVVFNWVPVRMDDATAKTFQRELLDLVQRLPVSTDAPTHLAGLFLAPLVR